MSTPTSRGIAALALLALLAACETPGGLTDSARGFRDAPVLALRVSGRDIVVQGPAGYCVDQRTAQDLSSGSFVMLGSCAILRGEGDSPGRPGVLTALVSPPSSPPQRPTTEQMEQFFRSPAGRAALAHDGLPSSVTVVTTEADDDILFLTVRDSSRDLVDDLDDMSWRAVFPLNDRLVALSVTSHVDRPIAPAQARDTLRGFVEAMLAANPPLRPLKRPEDPL